ncbi:MAG: RiPP maturation radical SAM C-methyltransferase [Clostridia bacterium]|nr:RiPP maturation radical SAM C-methyltransferase [Clostridia bacterium]
MKKVLLVSMPYGALERPSLGISLLKPILEQEGIRCHIRYLSFPFAEMIGHKLYNLICSDLPYTAFAGDWTFAQALYGENHAQDDEYVNEILINSWNLDQEVINSLFFIRNHVENFLNYCMEAVPWQDYDLVGFTSTFEQNLASLALAKRLKEKYPGITIVFGGANWEEVMGQGLHSCFPFVDYACSGEAEISFPKLVKRVFANDPLRPDDDILGIIYRHEGRSLLSGPPETMENLDTLPLPDFSDYFAALAHSYLSSEVTPILLMETSRGCWWGAKSRCLFCGLNGNKLMYRSKSPSRALMELNSLVDQWNIDLVEAVDNIMDMKYFTEMLPQLAESNKDINIFYEIKANLTKEQVALLSKAGVFRVQPGIESLSDNILRIMGKGTTALKNIQLLKWCYEKGLYVDWNLLYGFPGEKPGDYQAILDILEAINFLQPPASCGPVRLDRFSPYFCKAEEYGLTNIRPIKSYFYIYPFHDEQVRNIAYSFDFDYSSGIDPKTYVMDVINFIDQWRNNPPYGKLSYKEGENGGLILKDSRIKNSLHEITLQPTEKEAYLFCDQIQTPGQVTSFLRKKFNNKGISEKGVLDFLDSLVTSRLMVTNGEHYLAIAVPE